MKFKAAGIMAAGICLALAVPFPAFADATKVVTLGADLTEEQRTRMLNYFQVDPNSVRIITISNQDERDHLASYIPMEQIGNYTVSSAYVKPTTSGGIKVRTANLNWVTGNRIAATLSTSGVKNCEVIAAAPFEVSGTGALTGVIMAYEVASGEELSYTKKELATQELVVTGHLGDTIGTTEATYVVNEAKMQVIADEIQSQEEIYNIVNNIVIENNYTVNEENITEVVELLTDISMEDYEYEDMRETLERVEENVSMETPEQDSEMNESGEPEGEDDENTEYEEDSILGGLDESILGENVISSSTEESEWNNPQLNVEQEDEWEVFPGAEEVESESVPEDADEWFVYDGSESSESNADMDQMDFTVETEMNCDSEDTDQGEELTGEDVTLEEQGLEDGTEESPENGEEETAEETEETTVTPEELSEESRAKYDLAESFCKAAYLWDTEALASLQEQGLLDAEAVFEPIWDQETGEALKDEVLKAFLKVLSQEDSTTELVRMMEQLDTVFGTMEDSEESALQKAGISEDETILFFENTLTFFSTLCAE